MIMFLFLVRASPASINSFRNNKNVNADYDITSHDFHLSDDENEDELDDIADFKHFLSNIDAADASRDVKAFAAFIPLISAAVSLLTWGIDKLTHRKKSVKDSYEMRNNKNRQYFKVNVYLYRECSILAYLQYFIFMLC